MELLVKFMLFCFGVIGATHILVDGNIFSWLRGLLQKILPDSIYHLFTCYQCMGTWVGFLFGYWLLSQEWQIVLVAGGAGSFLATVAALLLNYLETSTMLDVDEDEDEY